MAIFTCNDEQQQRLISLCKQFQVQRLSLFGSAVSSSYDAVNSDLDFLVDFANPKSMSLSDQFFNFALELEALFNHKVDLIERSAIKNPFFLRTVEQAEVTLYDA